MTPAPPPRPPAPTVGPPAPDRVGQPPAGPDPDQTDVVTDGRQLRRTRNRQAVVDALLALYREGNLRPSADEIAARSGLSPRSLFRYFDDVDDLIRTAITRIELQARGFMPIEATPADPLGTKVEALAVQRFRLFDAMGPAAAVSRLRAPFEPVIGERLTRNRSLLRHQLTVLFAPELGALGPDRGPAALAAADVLASYESYCLLTVDQALTPPRARAAMAASLAAVLGPPS
jgi:AcrR family transcriptional regulator